MERRKLKMQFYTSSVFNNAANIFKYLEKYFNVFKALTDFFFCLAYTWPKSRKDDVVLAMTKCSGLRYQISSSFFFFSFSF